MNDRWFFGSFGFRRIVTDDDPRLFPTTVATTIDVVAATGRRVIDVGAVVYAPLSFVALFDTAGAASTFANQLGTVQTLIAPSGGAQGALLTEATVLVRNGISHRVRCTFEAVT